MTTTKRATCAVCRTTLEQPATGRPRRFCGEACRRVASREVERLDSRLATLERDRHDLRLRLAEFEVTGPGGTKVVPMAEARLRVTDEAIAEAVARQRELLSDEESA